MSAEGSSGDGLNVEVGFVVFFIWLRYSEDVFEKTRIWMIKVSWSHHDWSSTVASTNLKIKSSHLLILLINPVLNWLTDLVISDNLSGFSLVLELR